MSGAIDYLKGRYKGLIKKPGQRGIAGWVFDIVDDDSLNRSADITDHIVEAGSTIQDHRVIKPTTISMRGYIGELVWEGAANDVQRAAEAITNRLATIPAYPGAKAAQAAQKVTALVSRVGYIAGQASAFLKRGKNLIDAVRGETDDETKQEKAFKDLDAIFTQGEPVEVETPWGVYPSMLIEAISTMQGADSKYISEFTVNLKEYREAGTKTTDFEGDDINASQIQEAADQQNGKINGSGPDRDSFLFKFVDKIRGA